jgi:hypothetical protein
MGFTLQSFSPSRSCTPFGAVALLPFMTSRSSALRTRGSRCPATSGLYSPRGSVSRSGPEGPEGPMLSWVFLPLQSFSLQTVVPASRSLPSCASDVRSPRRPDGRRFKALPDLQAGPTLTGRPDSLEVFHQDLPSGSPDDSGVLSDGSERIWSNPAVVRPVRRPNPSSEEDDRVRSEDCAR